MLEASHAAIAAIALSIPAAAIAAPPQFPLLTFNANGVTSYDPDSREFRVTATPLAVRFSATTPPRFVQPGNAAPPLTVQFDFRIDNDGTLIGGDGDDLLITGRIDADGDGTIDYDGVLLRGVVLEFTIENTGGTTDLMDLRFAHTGGALAPLFGVQSVGMDLTIENSSFNGSFQQPFGGGAKGVLGTGGGGGDDLCDLDVVAEACVDPAPPPVQDQCEGKVTRLTLVYTGEGCGASDNDQGSKARCEGGAGGAEPVRIRVTGKRGRDVFADVSGIPIDGEVMIAAANAGESKLPSEIRVHIIDAAGNTVESNAIHTSCSRPLATGDRFGSLLVTALSTTEGGDFTLEPPDAECETEFMDSGSGVECEGKVTRLELEYLGGDCSRSMNDQKADKVSCWGDAGAAEPVRILVTDDKNKHVYADASGISLGGIVTATAANAGRSRFESGTRVRIYNASGALIQDLEFHTSCSQPLAPGDRFGAIRVAGMETTEGGSSSLGADVTYTYTVTNSGTAPVSGITVVDAFGPVPGSPIASLAPGETVVLEATGRVLDTFTNVVDVMGTDALGRPCDQQAEVTVTRIEPRPSDDCCESGSKLGGLLLSYTGEDCSASRNSQDPKKVSCDGDPGDASPVRIIVTDKDDPNDHKAKIWFDGTVALGQSFEALASNEGESKLKSSTFVFVIGAGGHVLQCIEFHTSCSQPLATGDQFGSIRVEGCYGESEGGNPEGFCEGRSKPRALTMVYTGLGCDASQNDQDPKKVSCEGDPAGATSVRIIASDKEEPDDRKAKIWFDGVVSLDGSFVIDAGREGERKLKSSTFVHVISMNGHVLQTVEFHTSCSQPLAAGDMFGSLMLIGFTPE